MNVSTTALRELRQATGAGMLDCVHALAETAGDAAAAEELLKSRGLAGVRERAARPAREGRIFLARSDLGAALVELRCETDFVALSEEFRELGSRAAEASLASGDGAAPELAALVAGLASRVRENLALGRIERLDRGAGERVEAYLHGDGRIGALARLRAQDEAAFDDPRIAGFLHDLALHVAAFSPLHLDPATVPASYREQKAAEFEEEVASDEKTRGMGAAAIERILAGKMRKHLSRACLLEQGFLRDEKLRTAEVLGRLAGETGRSLAVTGFARLGIEDALVLDPGLAGRLS